MATSKISGYKVIFGFTMPDWVDERMLNLTVGYALGAVVMMFALILVVNPNTDKVKELESRYAAESKSLETMRESRRSLEKLVQDVSEAEQAAVFRAMPVEYSPEEAVYSFRRIANQTGVSIAEYVLPAGVIYEDGVVEFSGGSGTSKETSVNFDKFVIQITVEGKIDSILNFIDKAQVSLPVAFVSDLTIREIVKAAESKAGSIVNLKLSVEYYQPRLKSFDLTGLQSFSDRELALMKEISGYARESLSPVIDNGSIQNTTGELRNIFEE